MSFKVNLYTLPKRDNSTKQPTGTGVEFNCVMKAGSGIMHPVLSFDLGLTNDPSQYNYAYIAAFERYYFIEEWYFNQSLWTATLKVDVLATYKTEIGGSSLYVLRAAGDHDGDIIDTLYPAQTGCAYDTDSKNNPWQSSCFIVGVVSADAAFGSMEFYAMDAAQLRSMCLALTDPATIIDSIYDFDVTELSTGLQLALVDPIQYVKSCIMLPVSKSDITNLGSGQTVKACRFDAGTGSKVYPTSRITKSFSFAIKKHPDTTARGNYVNSKPFTNITLTIPPWGCIDIDTSVTCNADSLSVEVEVDPISGKGILIVKAIIGTKSIILNRLEAQVGVPISLSSVTRDYIGAATSALGAVGGAVSGLMGNIGGFIGAASGVGNAVESLMPRAQTIGTTGSFVSNRGEFRLDHQFFRPVADDNTHNGRPLCAVKQINTLSGYMMIQDGDVTINGTSAEDSMIRNYLESGFYYE